MNNDQTNDTTTERTRAHGVKHKRPRQTFTVRMPEDVYFSDWVEMHHFIQSFSPDGLKYSNSVLTRLGVWALKWLKAQAEEAGPEAVAEFGRELHRVAHEAATRHKTPHPQAKATRVYNNAPTRYARKSAPDAVSATCYPYGTNHG